MAIIDPKPLEQLLGNHPARAPGTVAGKLQPLWSKAPPPWSMAYSHGPLKRRVHVENSFVDHGMAMFALIVFSLCLWNDEEDHIAAFKYLRPRMLYLLQLMEN
jgi:hypothetical protein